MTAPSHEAPPPTHPLPQPSPPPGHSHWLLAAWAAAGVALLVFSFWALPYADRWHPDGITTATIWRPGDDAPVRTTNTPRFDPERLAAEAGLDPRAPFIVEWRALLVTEETGMHRLRVRVDDGVTLWVDETPLIDQPGNVGQIDVMGQIHLARGLHSFRLRYVQHGGDSLLRVSWALPSYREEFLPLLLAADAEPRPLFRRIEKARAYPLRVAVLWSLWVIAGLALGGGRLLAMLAGRRIPAVLGWRALAALAVVALPLLALPLHVGVDPWRGWGPDEIRPRDALAAASQGFAGGWFHLYPPLHFYLLGLVNAPMMLLEAWDVLDYGNPNVIEAIHTVDRAVSVMLAWVTLLSVATLAARVATPRTALLAPFILSGIPLFGFYARTTNTDMPYTFWVCAAALGLSNATRRRTVRNHAVLGAVAAAAMASKDQAYGYFTGPAVLLLWLSWRETVDSPRLQRVWRTATDRRLWAGLVACLGLYTLLLGIWWNPQGVLAHFELITGPASVPFRMFPPTLDGYAQLAATTASLLGQAVGPFVVAAGTIGMGVTVSSGASRQCLGGLVVMTAGYLTTFVGAVGYVYDRFLVAVLPLVALLAARGTASGLDRISRAHVRSAVTVLVLSAYLTPGALLVVRQLSDTRFEAETWMRDHLLDDPLVLGVGTALYLPNLYPFQHRIVPTAAVAELLEWNPRVIVLNGDWLDRPGQPPRSMVTQDLARAGFEQMYTVERIPAVRRLWPLLASGLHIHPLYSNLGKLSPPLSVWVRRDSAAAGTRSVTQAAAPRSGGR